MRKNLFHIRFGLRVIKLILKKVIYSTQIKAFHLFKYKKVKPIEWDDNEKTIDLGIIEYELFDDVKFGHIGNIKTINQMEFLAILIFGNTP